MKVNTCSSNVARRRQIHLWKDSCHSKFVPAPEGNFFVIVLMIVIHKTFKQTTKKYRLCDLRCDTRSVYSRRGIYSSNLRE